MRVCSWDLCLYWNHRRCDGTTPRAKLADDQIKHRRELGRAALVRFQERVAATARGLGVRNLDADLLHPCAQPLQHISVCTLGSIIPGAQLAMEFLEPHAGAPVN